MRHRPGQDMVMAVERVLATKDLVSPRRFDIAVKWRLFRHLRNDNDPDAERIYRWHILKRSGHRMSIGIPTDKWKRSVEHYLSSAKALYGAMVSEGFDPGFPIPIDPDGDLLDGSHRLACALALGIGMVPVERRKTHVFAPAWDRDWFLANGMSVTDLEHIRQDWNALRGLHG